MFGPSRPTIITLEKVKEYHDLTPKRICFNSSHKNALTKRENQEDAVGDFNLPFDESVGRIFRKETGFHLIRNRFHRYWFPIPTEQDYIEIERFKEKYQDIVFLRDNLDISIALSEHMQEDGETRTEMGELEHAAKYEDDEDAIEEIVGYCVNFIKNTPIYEDVKYICAVPCSRIDEYNVPMIIAEKVAEKLNITSLCEEISWSKNKEGLKEMVFDDKWPALENTGMDIECDIDGKDVILIDDLYQSGTTMQFVAMKLKEAGCNKVYGLSIVKSRRDSDNN